MISVKDYVRIRKEEFKNRIEKLNGYRPTIKIISFKNDSSNESYIRGIKKDCEELGIHVESFLVSNPSLKDKYTLSKEISIILKWKECDGFIMQNPIPEHLPKLDFQRKENLDIYIPSIVYPCTPSGVIDYLKYIEYDFQNKVACVIGRSDTIGKPLAEMLLKENATVITCHSKTSLENMMHLVDDSDIVFTCIDKIEYFTDDYFMGIKDIIDFGIGIGKDGKLHGNLTSECVRYNKSWNPNGIIISGSGGTGLLTRIKLFDNLISNAEKNYRELSRSNRG